MKLYKFRSFSNFDFVLDILLKERLHCSLFDKLNDPCEGLFLSAIHIPNALTIPMFPIGLGLGVRKHTMLSSISELSIIDKIRICSLSASLGDVRLWSHYADGHRGVAIEIDFDGRESEIHKVDYINQLKEFSNTILTGPRSEDVLRLKTNHWEYEEEFRIISDVEYFSIKGMLSAVYCGIRISDLHQELLLRSVSNRIPVFSTKLNEKTVTIEPQKQLNSTT